MRKLIEKCQSDPLFFVEDIRGSKLWHKQKEVMLSVRDNQFTAVKSGHGVGKTRTAAETVLWFLNSFFPSKVITTAPTWNQVETILWSEINRLHKTSRIPLGGTMLTTQLKISEDHFGIGLSTNEPTKFQGHHSEHVLVLFDEATGVRPDIWEAAHGLLTNNHARFLAIGNPTIPYGPFYDAFKSPLYNKITISCLEIPEEGFPGLTTRAWCEQMRQEFGENSPIYKSRVLGEFPIEGDDTLIPLTWVEKAIDRQIAETDATPKLGIDVARYGDDSTVFTVVKGKKVLHIESFQGKNTTQTVGKGILLYKKFNCDKIAVDDTGVGGGVVDQLEEQNYPVIPVNFGSSAIDTDRFDNLKTEIFWNLREDFEHNEISIPNHPELVQQLPGILYEMTSRGKLKIVGKDQMKKLGMKSPDFADSLVIAHYANYANKDAIFEYYQQRAEEADQDQQLNHAEQQHQLYQSFLTNPNLRSNQ